MAVNNFDRSASKVPGVTRFGELAKWYHTEILGGLMEGLELDIKGFNIDSTWIFEGMPGKEKERIDALEEMGAKRTGENETILHVPYSVMPREYQEATIMDCILRLKEYLKPSTKQFFAPDDENLILKEKVIRIPNDPNVLRIAQRLLDFLPEQTDPNSIFGHQNFISDDPENENMKLITGPGVGKIISIVERIKAADPRLGNGHVYQPYNKMAVALSQELNKFNAKINTTPAQSASKPA